MREVIELQEPRALFAPEHYMLTTQPIFRDEMSRLCGQRLNNRVMIATLGWMFAKTLVVPLSQYDRTRQSNFWRYLAYVSYGYAGTVRRAIQCYRKKFKKGYTDGDYHLVEQFEVYASGVIASFYQLNTEKPSYSSCMFTRCSEKEVGAAFECLVLSDVFFNFRSAGVSARDFELGVRGVMLEIIQRGAQP